MLRAAFHGCGFALRTVANPGEPSLVTPGLIEVYPHPALVELTGEDERLRYKVGKTQTYWRELKLVERRQNLLFVWKRIVDALDHQIDGVAAALREVGESPSGLELKAYEDSLDAVVCAWVGVCALEGLAEALGDSDSAIWIPARRRKWPSRRS
jgi:predicted RNase H-like nuclease